MSDLTPCNYCTLQGIKRDNKGKNVTLVALPFARHALRVGLLLAIGYTLHRWFL